jgi:hypothetical protein
MDRVYINRIACGIQCIVPYGVLQGNSHIYNIINDYNDILNYSSTMSLLEKGGIFVYLKSSYQEIQSNTCEYIHLIDNSRTLPTLSNREVEAVNKLLAACYCDPKTLMWIQHADVFSF